MAVAPDIYADVTVSAGATRAFARYLVADHPHLIDKHTRDVLEVLRPFGIDPRTWWSRPDSRIPCSAGNAMLELLIETTGDAAAGLHAAEHCVPADADLVGYLMRCAATYGEMLELWRRYQSLMGPTLMEVSRRDERIIVQLRLPPDLTVPQAHHDFEMASIVVLARVPGFIPLAGFGMELHFAHDPPPYVDEYYRIMGDIPVHFGSPYYAFTFSAEGIDQPMPGADPVLLSILKRTADAALEALPDRGSLSGRVRAAIEVDLEASRGDLTTVARALGLSATTLRRRLRDNNTPYNVLLEQTRRDVACRLLEDAELNLSQVAGRVGFSGLPTFHRAFKRWYGNSPGDYRRSHFALTG